VTLILGAFYAIHFKLTKRSFLQITKAFLYGLTIETHRYEVGMNSNGL